MGFVVPSAITKPKKTTEVIKKNCREEGGWGVNLFYRVKLCDCLEAQVDQEDVLVEETLCHNEYNRTW